MILDAPADPPPSDDGTDGGAPVAPTGNGVDVAAGRPADGTSAVLVQQCAWTLVWIGMLAAGLQYWGSWSSGVWAAVLAPMLVAVALAGAVLLSDKLAAERLPAGQTAAPAPPTGPFTLTRDSRRR